MPWASNTSGSSRFPQAVRQPSPILLSIPNVLPTWCSPAPSPPTNFGEEPVFSKEMLDLVETSWQRPMIANMFADVLLTPGGNALDRSFVSEMLRRANDGPTLAAFYRTSGEIDVTEAAKRIQIPTLVIQARDDAIVPLEIGRAQASLIPGAKLEIVEGGHMASSASTAETRRRALEFLAEGK